MVKRKGFCDLNIQYNDNVKKTVLSALKLGYHIIAINVDIDDSIVLKKKDQTCPIPEPKKVKFSEEELKKSGISKPPLIKSRITIKYSNPSSVFIHKYKNAIEAYDIIAYAPTTEAVFKQVCQGITEIDIISLPMNLPSKVKLPYKLFKLASQRDIYFEFMYSRCLTDSKSRQECIIMCYAVLRMNPSLHVIISSGADRPSLLRQPYDVANLGRFFGLTEAAAKAAISSLSHNVIYCAEQRRHGALKCMASIRHIEACEGDSNASLVKAP